MRKKRSACDLSATAHHLVKSRSGPCAVPWYFYSAFQANRKFWLMCRVNCSAFIADPPPELTWLKCNKTLSRIPVL